MCLLTLRVCCFLIRLDQLGQDIGGRFLELCYAREKPGKREVKLVNLLQYVSTSFWKTVFGKKADGVEKSKEHDNVCACSIAPCFRSAAATSFSFLAMLQT